MMKVSTLLDNKTHIIYVSVILAVLGVGYTLLSRKPKEIIKTEIVTKVETKVVTKDVIQTKKVYIDRTRETKKANGDIITETTHTRTDNEIVDRSKEKDLTKNTSTKQEIIRYASRYSLDIQYPMSIMNITSPVFNPLDLQALVGIRLFESPLFITTGTDGHFNKILVGVRIEF